MGSTEQSALLVRQEVQRRDGELHYREDGLSLSADGRALVLHCYFENYRPEHSTQVTCSYQVSLAEFTHWMIRCGELRMHS